MIIIIIIIIIIISFLLFKFFGQRHLIHRMVEFVIREGPEFEALIMQRVADDPKVKA